MFKGQESKKLLLVIGCGGGVNEAGWGVLLPAPQEEGERGIEFGFLDSKSSESIERCVKCLPSCPIEVRYA
jgi:hypothetical protein